MSRPRDEREEREDVLGVLVEHLIALLALDGGSVDLGDGEVGVAAKRALAETGLVACHDFECEVDDCEPWTCLVRINTDIAPFLGLDPAT